MEVKLKVDDSKLRALIKRVRAGPHVRVGVLAEEGGLEETESGLTIIDIAIIHEFGAPAANIPERSWIRRTLTEKEKEIAKLTAKLARQMITAGMPIATALDLLGMFVATEIKKTVTAGPHIPPPLAPATVARKGSDRPLVDTAQMINSVTHKVEA